MTLLYTLLLPRQLERIVKEDVYILVPRTAQNSTQRRRSAGMEPGVSRTNRQEPGPIAALYEEFGRALLVSVYSSERLSDEKHDFLLYARPISRVYVRELKVHNQNFSVSGAASEAIRFSNPDVGL